MSNLNKIKVVDYTMGRRSSDDVNTDIPFSDNFAKTRTIQQANVVLGAYVNRNYKDNRQWLNELENKADKDEIPEKTSDLTNDGSDGENPFITNQVDDLVNYTNNSSLNDIITPIENMLDGTKPAGNMIVDSIRSKNMFDKNTATRGYYISDTGVITTFSDTFYSDFIPVKPNTQYSVSGKTDWLITALYDNNKTFITRVNDSDLITTSSTYYIRTIGLISDINNIQVEKGSVVTSYSPYQNLDNSGTILFDGESTSADIQLLDSLNKYEYVDIFYGNIYSGIKKIKFKVSNNNTFVLSSTELDIGNGADFGIVIVNNKYTFDTNYLRYLGTSRVYKYESGNWVQDRNNSNYIYRVIGY